MSINRALGRFALAALVMGGMAQGAWADPELGVQVPGEGISGTLVRPDAELPEAPFRFSAEELENLGLTRRAGPEVETAQLEGTELPPTPVTVYTTRSVQVAFLAPPDHHRRSLASRGAANVAQRAVRYKTVKTRVASRLDLTPIILAKARKYNLDPWLVRGVIEVESSFNPYATSCAGAGGLMQLMPGTAYHLGCRDRYDPEQNIEAGARYLRQMMDRFGSWDLAIAAYNAGPGNVERAGGIPNIAETRRYVVKVKKAWQRRP